MNLTDYHRIYFLGIGGIGMSGLARWFHHAGYQVAGYDKTPSEITDHLIQEGIPVTFDESEEAIPEEFKDKKETLVVYTPAIPKAHMGYQYFLAMEFNVIKRSVALGLITKDKTGIAVAGTHGKTSISTAVAWLMNDNCSAFLGGISKNLQNNVIINGASDNVVIEADEFDRSFLTLYPQIAVISAMDADHLDIYGTADAIQESFFKFVEQIKPEGTLIYKKGLSIPQSINAQINYLTYSLENSKADFYAEDIQVVDGYFGFTLVTPDKKIENLRLGIPGLYNLENAVAALAAALLAGTQESNLKDKLNTFQGVKRRFDFHIRTSNLLYLDDYAHHPEEIKACIQSIRHLYPGKHLTAVFQPHLFTRTRDFVDEFAKSLDACDKVLLLPIYPAREEPIEGVSSEIILEKMHLQDKQLCSNETLIDTLLMEGTEIVVTMGAGNIDRLVKPITEALIQKYKLQ